MQLKPHDLVVTLKLLIAGPLTYDQLAASLHLSKSEAHAAVKRAKAAGLLRADRQPIHHAILEFVLHGVRYAFPAVRGRQAQGMPTDRGAGTTLPVPRPRRQAKRGSDQARRE